MTKMGDRKKVMQVTCPTCRALPGNMCKRPNGEEAGAMHATRWDLWRNSFAAPTTVKPASGVKRVVRYVADDGTEHETHAAARKHNGARALESWLANWLYAEGIQNPATVANGLSPALRKDWNISKRKEKKS